MGLAPSTGSVKSFFEKTPSVMDIPMPVQELGPETQDMLKRQLHKEVLNEEAKAFFDPKNMGMELSSLMIPGSGGLVSMIQRSAARKAVVKGLQGFGTLKKYHGYNPIKWWANNRLRSNARDLLKQVNKLPQEIMDPVEKINFFELQSHADRIIKGKTSYAQYGGKRINVDPWIKHEQKGNQSISHEFIHGKHEDAARNLPKSFAEEDIMRLKKEKILMQDLSAQQHFDTYSKNYKNVGAETAAFKYEQLTKNFSQATDPNAWQKAYDEALDAGVEVVRKHSPYKKQFMPIVEAQMKNTLEIMDHIKQNGWRVRGLAPHIEEEGLQSPLRSR